jgi:hypothetical protein
VKSGNEEYGHRDWYYMYLLNKWWWKCNADKVPWFRAVSTSGRRPIYRQRETVLECLVLGQGRLWAAGRSLIGTKDVDLPLKARRRATTLSERMGWVHGLVDPVSLQWEVSASTGRLSDGTCGCGPVWMAEDATPRFPHNGNRN